MHKQKEEKQQRRQKENTSVRMCYLCIETKWTFISTN